MYRTYEFIIDGNPQGREIQLEETIPMPEGFGHNDIYGDTPDKIQYKDMHTEIHLSRKGKYAHA